MNELRLWEPFSNIDEETLRVRIREFRRLNYRTVSDEKLVDSLLKTFAVATSEGPILSFPTHSAKYVANTKFFRVRKIPNDDRSIPLKTMRDIKDAWEPPAHLLTGPGRVNRPHQPVLYTCPSDPMLAVAEAGVPVDDYFCMMIYDAHRDIVVSTIGGEYPIDGLSNGAAAKLEMFHDFLETEFTREVGGGSEHLYRLSQAIADTFYNYPDQDAWAYRSIVDRTRFNCAFLPGCAAKCLSLTGVLVGQQNKEMTKGFSVKMVVDFDPETGNASYHAIGSETQRRLFPEIT